MNQLWGSSLLLPALGLAEAPLAPTCPARVSLLLCHVAKVPHVMTCWVLKRQKGGWTTRTAQAPPPGLALDAGGLLPSAGPEDVAGSTQGSRSVLATALGVGIIRLNTMLNLISMISKLSKADFSSLICIYT